MGIREDDILPGRIWGGSPEKETMQDMTHLLRCPLCGGAFSRKENSLICDKRHTYDIARQGYVNFVPGQKEMFYKKELFESRAKVFEAGVFAPVIDRLSQAVARYVACEKPVLLDAGCGEGYYTKAVCPDKEMTRIGFDLSKDAVKLAARGAKTALFFAADLKNIPMQDHTVNVLLDIFTPANYAEFARVLTQDGLVMKLAPRSGYLKQLRMLAGDKLRHQEYDGGDVERYVHEKMNVVAQETITYTMPVTQETAYHLARMTPMLAGVDVDALDLSGVTEITIDETLYIGSVK
ncbi:MAG: methyltransferase domain-containing protein [Clostridia bacterium]|nr:methyltransferase domain-containing protein [Clostridia bacterium]